MSWKGGLVLQPHHNIPVGGVYAGWVLFFALAIRNQGEEVKKSTIQLHGKRQHRNNAEGAHHPKPTGGGGGGKASLLNPENIPHRPKSQQKKQNPATHTNANQRQELAQKPTKSKRIPSKVHVRNQPRVGLCEA